MIKVGDVFEIPLSGNRKAAGHFVLDDKNHGPFIQVFDYIEDKDKFDLQEAISSRYMFPPVVTGLKAAVRSGLWRIIGNKPVKDFQYPKFISSYWNDKTGKVMNWFLLVGNDFIKIGPKLPEEYKSLEYLVVWSPYDVIYRIETGSIPFPYGEMIRNNQFTPLARKKTNDG